MTTVRVALLAVVCGALGGCVSPETTRRRGGGPGADVGNRTQDVKMHEGSEPYWRTPEIITGSHPSLDPSLQARKESRASTRAGRGR